jgi:peptidoglycan hydrolase-like protein with peptidoglycan-binding domain
VKALQQFLNSHSFTLAPSGNGSPSQETTFFGPRTRNALTKFQEFYASEILTPLGLTKGTGTFGEETRKKVREMGR